MVTNSKIRAPSRRTNKLILDEIRQTIRDLEFIYTSRPGLVSFDVLDESVVIDEHEALCSIMTSIGMEREGAKRPVLKQRKRKYLNPGDLATKDRLYPKPTLR